MIHLLLVAAPARSQQQYNIDNNIGNNYDDNIDTHDSNNDHNE